MLTDGSAQQLLVEWNDTAARRILAIAASMNSSRSRSSATPDAVAVVFEDKSGLPTDELNTRANQFAHYLHDAGVGPDVLVGLCVDAPSR